MNMSDGDISWLEWVIGGISTAGAAVGGLGWSVLNNRIKEQGAEIREGIADQNRKLEKEIADNISERRRMWTRLDTFAEQVAKNRLEDYTVFVSKDDLGRLERNIADMLERHEKHIRDIVNNRGPVRDSA